MVVSKIEEAVAALAAGGLIVVVDSEDRENEGDVIAASELVTAETISFMMKNARGLICIAMEGQRLDALEIPLMVPRNTDANQTAFTVSVDYAPETSTGISAADRAATARALVNPMTRAQDFTRPGHLFPLRSHPRGVLGRPGHTEAAVDLCRLASLRPSGVICEIANDDGSMARVPELIRFAEKFGLPLITIADLIEFLQASSFQASAAA